MIKPLSVTAQMFARLSHKMRAGWTPLPSALPMPELYTDERIQEFASHDAAILVELDGGKPAGQLLRL